MFQWFMIAAMQITHPLFVSLTDVHYNKEEYQVEVSVRIFTDDLETVLRKSHAGKLDILHPGNENDVKELINRYVNDHLKMKVNGINYPLHFEGYEPENENIWSYFTIEGIKEFTQVELENSLLFDLTKEQINLIDIHADGKEHSIKLNYPETYARFMIE